MSFIGFEISEEYCDIIKERLKQNTLLPLTQIQDGGNGIPPTIKIVGILPKELSKSEEAILCEVQKGHEGEEMRSWQIKAWILSWIFFALLFLAIIESRIGGGSASWFYMLGLTEIVIFGMGLFVGGMIRGDPQDPRSDVSLFPPFAGIESRMRMVPKTGGGKL